MQWKIERLAHPPFGKQHAPGGTMLQIPDTHVENRPLNEPPCSKQCLGVVFMHNGGAPGMSMQQAPVNVPQVVLGSEGHSDPGPMNSPPSSKHSSMGPVVQMLTPSLP
jgi:hypothetical protein